MRTYRIVAVFGLIGALLLSVSPVFAKGFPIPSSCEQVNSGAELLDAKAQPLLLVQDPAAGPWHQYVEPRRGTPGRIGVLRQLPIGLEVLGFKSIDDGEYYGFWAQRYSWPFPTPRTLRKAWRREIKDRKVFGVEDAKTIPCGGSNRHAAIKRIKERGKEAAK